MSAQLRLAQALHPPIRAGRPPRFSQSGRPARPCDRSASRALNNRQRGGAEAKGCQHTNGTAAAPALRWPISSARTPGSNPSPPKSVVHVTTALPGVQCSKTGHPTHAQSGAIAPKPAEFSVLCTVAQLCAATGSHQALPCTAKVLELEPSDIGHALHGASVAPRAPATAGAASRSYQPFVRSLS